MKRSLALSLAVVMIAFAGPLHASKFAEAPAESRAQVQNAVALITPFFDGKTRTIASGAPGSLEAALLAYAPARFHVVDEGALPKKIASTSVASCPSDMALVDSRFCIDKYEACLEEIASDGTHAPHSPYAKLDAGHVYVARSLPDVVPQAYVSGREAEGACARAKKRLCGAVEWRVACGGSQGYAFPYGGQKQPGKCHDSGVAPMLVLYPEQAKKGAFGVPEMNDPKLNQLPNSVAKTGSFKDCKNDFGVYDMVGNLHEWVADTNGTFQGGFWLDTEQHGDGCAYRTIAHDFSYHDYSTGFRCCGDPAMTSAP